MIHPLAAAKATGTSLSSSEIAFLGAFVVVALIVLPISLLQRFSDLQERSMAAWPFGRDSARDWVRALPLISVAFASVLSLLIAANAMADRDSAVSNVLAGVAIGGLGLFAVLIACVVLFNRPKIFVARFRRDETATFSGRIQRRRDRKRKRARGNV